MIAWRGFKCFEGRDGARLEELESVSCSGSCSSSSRPPPALPPESTKARELLVVAWAFRLHGEAGTSLPWMALTSPPRAGPLLQPGYGRTMARSPRQL